MEVMLPLVDVPVAGHHDAHFKVARLLNVLGEGAGERGEWRMLREWGEGSGNVKETMRGGHVGSEELGEQRGWENTAYLGRRTCRVRDPLPFSGGIQFYVGRLHRAGGKGNPLRRANS